jgi:hypothetical protein
MPKATVSTETVRKELENLPGGFVVLRKLNYGEILKSRDMLSSIQRRDDRKEREDSPMTVDMNLGKISAYQFSRAIVDHNLEDDNGQKLNFSNPNDINILDPVVAQEIDRLITTMNEPLKEEDKVPLDGTSGESSKEKAKESA